MEEASFVEVAKGEARDWVAFGVQVELSLV